MRVNSSQSGHIRASGASGYPPRYPSESTSPAASAAHLPTTRSAHSGGSINGFLAPPRHTHSPSAVTTTTPPTTNGIHTSSSTSYDGKRVNRASGPAAPELDLNGSTSLKVQSQRRNSGSLFQTTNNPNQNNTYHQYNSNSSHPLGGAREGNPQTSASSPRAPPPPAPQSQSSTTTSGQRGGNANALQSLSHDGTVPNGVLLGSLAGYLPSSAVALANASAANQATTTPNTATPPPPPPQQHSVAAQTPQANSPRVNARARLGESANALQPDLRTSRQSITVLSVTRDGTAQDDTRPPSNASMNMNGSMSDMRLGGPALPPRKASFNQVGDGGGNGSGGRHHAPPPRVQREAIAAIPLSDASTSTNLSSVQRNAFPPAGAYRQQSPQQQQQQPDLQQRGHNMDSPAGQLSSRASTVAPKQQYQQQQSRPSPVPQPARTHSTSPHPQQQQQHYSSPRRDQHANTPPQQHNGNTSTPATGGELVLVTHPPQASRASPSHRALSPTQHVVGGAVLHHRPSPAALSQYQHDGDAAGPATLQVSTTTLTKACKKVRYLRPGDVFDPDAPDPSDQGGLTAEEEEALLDPVHFTRAADGVAGRYPMLLRRPSAQGGDLLRGRRGSGDALDQHGAPRPTFLLDDGNRWARETNRPTVATTRDPTGTALTTLPSPSILQKGHAHRGGDPESAAPFPAYQKVGAAGSAEGATEDGQNNTNNHTDGAAGGYLLQRHVQQMATGRQLVSGTVFEPPAMTQRQRERRAREEAEDRQEAAAASPHRHASPASHRRGSAKAAEAGEVKPRRGPTDGLYEEIIRRTNQNRRATLPATVTVTPAVAGRAAAGPALMPPLAPTSSSAARPPMAPQPPQQPQPPSHPRGPAGGSTSGRRRGRQHPNSAEPTPLHKPAGVHHYLQDQPQHQQPPSSSSQQDAHTPRNPHQHRPPQPYAGAPPPARASSQPYITSTYVEGTPIGSDASGMPADHNYYYSTPNTEAGYYASSPPSQQQQQQQTVNRRPLLPPPPPPSHGAPQQQPPQRPRPPLPQQYLTHRRTSASSNGSSIPAAQRRTSNSDLQDSPPPRQQQLPTSSEATPDPSVASTTPSMPGYTSGRFSKYNPPGSTLPPPPPAIPPPTAPATRSEATTTTTEDDRRTRRAERAPGSHPAIPPSSSNNNSRRSNRNEQENGSHDARLALPPPPPPQPQPRTSSTQRQRRATATPPPAEPPYASPQQPMEVEDQRSVPHTQHRLAPPPPPAAAAAAPAQSRAPRNPPPPQQLQQQQQPSMSKPSTSSTTRRNTRPPPPPPQAPPAAATATPYASPYADEEDVYTTDDQEDYAGDYNNSDDDQTYEEDDYVVPNAAAAAASNGVVRAGSEAAEDELYTTDEDIDGPVTDAAQQQHNITAPHIRTSSNNVSNNVNNNTSSGSAGAEVRRSLLEQYNNGDDDGSQDTPRGTPRRPASQQRRPPPPQQQQQQQAQKSNVPPRNGRESAYERSSAPPPPPPPPPAATATAASPGGNVYDGLTHEGEPQQPPQPPAQEDEDGEMYEEAPSVASCDTGTQPVELSERGSDELNGEEDDLVKKGPLVLKLGDEVYAPEGFEVEEGEYFEEDEEEGEYYDDVEGGEAEEEGYWESPEGEAAAGEHAAAAAAAAPAQRNSSVRYDEGNTDEL